MNQQNTQQQSNTPPPKPIYQFRSFWLLTPISLGVLIYILTTSECVISWQAILEKIGIVDKARFTRLFLLCVIATAVVILTKLKKSQ